MRTSLTPRTPEQAREVWAKMYPRRATVKGADAVIFYDPDGLRAAGMYGKQRKPDFHYRFRNQAEMEKTITRWIEKVHAIETNRANRKSRKSEGHPLKVGRILVCSWGYDQTNTDFYEVTAITDCTATIRPIGSRVAAGSKGCDYVAPTPGKFTGKPMTKRPTKDGAVRIASYASAYPWDGEPRYETAFGYGH